MAGEEDEEPTMGERLEALTAAMAEQQGGGSDAEEADLGRGGSRGLQISKEGVVAGGSSLSTVLEQALQTNDTAALEMVLQVTERATIEATVGRLQAVKVLPFLTKIINRFQSKPSRGPVLIQWIRCILTTHASYLTSVPGLVHKLAPLYQVRPISINAYIVSFVQAQRA